MGPRAEIFNFFVKYIYSSKIQIFRYNYNYTIKISHRIEQNTVTKMIIGRISCQSPNLQGRWNFLLLDFVLLIILLEYTCLCTLVCIKTRFRFLFYSVSYQFWLSIFILSILVVYDNLYVYDRILFLRPLSRCCYLNFPCFSHVFIDLPFASSLLFYHHGPPIPTQHRRDHWQHLQYSVFEVSNCIIAFFLKCISWNCLCERIIINAGFYVSYCFITVDLAALEWRYLTVRQQFLPLAGLSSAMSLMEHYSIFLN